MKNQHVCILDKDRNSASFLQYRLGARGFRVSVFRRVEDLFMRLRVEQPVCVIMDSFSPDIQDEDLISRLKAESPEASIIYFSGSGDEWVYQRAMEAGVTDFILKGQDLSGVTELTSNLQFILAENSMK